MPRKCSVSGCRSNYRGEEGEHVTTFCLPKEESLQKQWIKKIPTDLSHIKVPQVCIQHFLERDIIRTDICFVKGERREFPRKIPNLKKVLFQLYFQICQNTYHLNHQLVDV